MRRWSGEHLLRRFVWVVMALAASVISVRLGISVALVEILVGTVVGNLPNASDYVQQTEFTIFLASLGSVMLTFLAGAEIDPVSLRRRWKASRSIGLVSFLLPFLGGPGVLPLGTRTGSEAKAAGTSSREGRARTASTGGRAGTPAWARVGRTRPRPART
jgi:Kef-type K+ transport system membrane component KefB